MIRGIVYLVGEDKVSDIVIATEMDFCGPDKRVNEMNIFSCGNNQKTNVITLVGIRNL
jgi:hypothetical protein